jgi:hypothetical protein
MPWPPPVGGVIDPPFNTLPPPLRLFVADSAGVVAVICLNTIQFNV